MDINPASACSTTASKRPLRWRQMALIAFALHMIAFVTSHAALAQQTADLTQASDTEKKIWAQLQVDGKATLGRDEKISARFVADVLTGKLYSATIKRDGVSISGGTLDGPLELRNKKVDLPIVHLALEIPKGIDASGTEFTGSLSFRGARLLGPLKASRTIIGGSLQLGELDDTTWFDNWVADRGPAFPVIASLDAPHLRLRGDLVVAGASIKGAVDLSNSEIGGSATFMHVINQGQDQGIDISASTINNALIVYDCVIRLPVNTKDYERPSLALYDLKISQTVYVTRSVIEGTLDISAAVIAGDFNLRGSELGEVKARATRVSGSFLFGMNTVKPLIMTRWKSPSSLDLTGARFGAIRAPEMPEAWPLHIHFDHFSTTLYSQEFCGSDGVVCQHSPKWYATFLARQASPRPSFEPYKQISEILVNQGLQNEALDLSVEGHQVLRDDAFRHGEIVSFLTKFFYGWTVGYGLHPEYAIYWAMGFIVLGALIFRKTHEAVMNGMPYGLAYSFDMLLPIVHLREKHYQIDLAGPQRYYFYLHKLVGWALSLLLVAVMTGLTSK